VDKLINTD